MEVEQNNLTLKVGKMALHTLIVKESDIKNSSLLNLAGIYLNICIL
jgi:hypothetical protein